MFMGYLFLECPDCFKKIRQSSKDIGKIHKRICPKCGRSFEISKNIYDGIMDLKDEPTGD